MFESIQKGLSDALRSIRGETRLTEANMRDGLQSVRRALIEADVNVNVATSFVNQVEQVALGRNVLKSLNPSQMIVQVVYEELCNLMGPVDPSIRLAPNRPTILMMCGLQGSGKTTTCAKLARLLVQQQQRPLLVAADLQRPAAVEQLKVLGAQLNVPVHAEENSNPIRVCQNAINAAKAKNCNVVILDTAGRLAIDETLMNELRTIDQRVNPDACYLVVDAMTGQDAVHTAKAFNDALELDAVVLTKLDGDARGGAALSIKEVTQVPIKFAGVGERIDALEPFRPEGMASRILGMGDVLSLVAKAQQTIDAEEALRQQKKMESGKFDLDDFRNQMAQVQQMGSIRSLLETLPNQFKELMPEDEDPEESLKMLNAMISSMTPAERRHPDLIEISRRRRIAAGSGVEPHEINRFLKQFEMMRDLMKKMASMSMMDRMRHMMSMARNGVMGLGGMLSKQKDRSVRGALSNKERTDKRKQERQRKKENRKRKR